MGELGEGLAAPLVCAPGRRAALLPGELCCDPVLFVRLRMLQPRQQTAGFTRLQVLSPLSKVDMHQLFDTLRAQGSLQLIGTEAGVLEEKWRRCASCLRHRSMPHVAAAKTCSASAACFLYRHGNGSSQSIADILSNPQAEIHLQVRLWLDLTRPRNARALLCTCRPRS